MWMSFRAMNVDVIRSQLTCRSEENQSYRMYFSVYGTRASDTSLLDCINREKYING
jgi:hypothetical protein